MKPSDKPYTLITFEINQSIYLFFGSPCIKGESLKMKPLTWFRSEKVSMIVYSKCALPYQHNYKENRIINWLYKIKQMTRKNMKFVQQNCKI